MTAIAKIENGKWDNGTSASGHDTTGANFIVLCQNAYVGFGERTLHDSKSNGNPTLLTIQDNNAGINHSSRLSYYTNPAVGANHTFSDDGVPGMFGGYWAAFSNVDTSSPFDQEQPGAKTTSSVTTLQCSGGLDAANNDSLFIVGVGVGANGPPTIDTGFHTTDSDSFSGGVRYGGGLFWYVETADEGSLNPTVTNTGGATTDFTLCYAVFKPGTGGGGVTIPIFDHHYLMQRSA